MKSKTIKNICFALVFVTFLSLTIPAFATTYSAGTSIYAYLAAGDNNVQFTGSYSWTQSVPPLASITVVNNNFDSNCNVKVDWYDSSNNIISTSNVSANGSNIINGPTGNTHFAIYASCSDTTTPSPQPWSYISSETDSYGNILNFDVPLAPSDGGGSTVDMTPVVSALEVIQGQLTAMQGQLNALSNSSSSSSGQLGNILTAIQNDTSAMDGKLNDINGSLGSIGGQLGTIQGQLNTLDSHVVDTYNYLSIPRSSQSIDVDMPTMTVNPTPPAITEPYQQPYIYDKQLPQAPPFIDSPGPLPLSPEPKVMPHDQPTQIQMPVQLEQPLTSEPVIMDNPIPKDPATMDTPRQIDYAHIQEPIAQEPVLKESPCTIDPVVKEQPITRADPIQSTQPLSKDTPYQHTAPLSPEPPAS